MVGYTEGRYSCFAIETLLLCCIVEALLNLLLKNACFPSISANKRGSFTNSDGQFHSTNNASMQPITIRISFWVIDWIKSTKRDTYISFYTNDCTLMLSNMKWLHLALAILEIKLAKFFLNYMHYMWYCFFHFSINSSPLP